MPIATDGTRLSIEFAYEFQIPSGEVLFYQMKFMHTENGPTVQIINGPYEPVELPAQMFTEVAEFLISQGVLRGVKPPLTGRSEGQQSGLPLPQIARRAGTTVAATRPAPQEPVEAMSKPIDPEEKARMEAMATARAEAQAKAAAKKGEKTLKKHHRPEDEE